MINEIRNVYSLLQDDLSKYIFENRWLYNITGEFKYIKNIVLTLEEGRKIQNCLENAKEHIGIFTAGIAGKKCMLRHRDIKFCCFIDNYKKDTVYEDLPVYSVSEFIKKYPNGTIIIPPTKYYKEIEKQLEELQIEKSKIVNEAHENSLLVQKQYFDLPQFKTSISKKEVFIDGGAYKGESTINFMKWCQSMDENIECISYIFEPEESNLIELKNNLSLENINAVLIKKGLWSKNAKMSFSSNESCSSIKEEGNLEIEVDCLDDIVDDKVTFIKMDIEGAEYEALIGAKNTISRYKPKLAISIYHKPEDIFEIAQLIYSLNPEYKFYLRHYSLSTNETVLYAL